VKLQTSIKPRRDGTVSVLGQDRQTYVFVADDEGLLTGDVGDEPTIAALLATGNFWPADEADQERALELVKQAQKADEDDEDDDKDEADENALPVEAETPPAPRRGRPRKVQ